MASNFTEDRNFPNSCFPESLTVARFLASQINDFGSKLSSSFLLYAPPNGRADPSGNFGINLTYFRCYDHPGTWEMWIEVQDLLSEDFLRLILGVKATSSILVGQLFSVEFVYSHSGWVHQLHLLKINRTNVMLRVRLGSTSLEIRDLPRNQTRRDEPGELNSDEKSEEDETRREGDSDEHEQISSSDHWRVDRKSVV